MRIQQCYKTQRVAVSTLWHAFQFQSGYTVHGVTWSNMSNWTMHQWQWSRGGLMGRCGLPSPSLCSRHWFNVNLDHLSCVNCTCYYVASLVGCTTEGPKIKVCVFSHSRQSPVGCFDNGWMWVVQLLPNTVGYPSSTVETWHFDPNLKKIIHLSFTFLICFMADML